MDREQVRARLLAAYRSFDRLYFGGALVWSDIRVVELPNKSGDGHSYGRWSYCSAGSLIKINRGIISGDIDEFRHMSEEGRLRFAEDVLLHEGLHQYMYGTGRHDGHGPQWLSECCRITQQMDHVRRRWRELLAPDTAWHWPDCVRKRSFYRG